MTFKFSLPNPMTGRTRAMGVCAMGVLCALFAAGTLGCSAPRNPKYEQVIQQKPAQPQNVEPQAVQEAKKELQKDEGKYSADAHFKLAKAYANQGKIEEAVNELNETLKINNKHVDAMLLFANLALLARQYDAVQGWTGRVLSLKPRSAEARLLRVVSYRRRGLLDHAVKECQTALSLNPVPEADLSARRILAEIYAAQGQALKDIQSKVAKYQAGLKLCDETLSKYPKASFFKIMKGDFVGKMGDRKAAVALYDQALQDDPKSVALRLQVAQLYVTRGIEKERALKAAQEAVELSPKASSVHMMLGRVYLSQGKPDDALTSFRQAQKLDKGPANQDLANLIAATLVRKQQFQEAEQELIKVVQDHPKQARPLVSLASFYIQQRRDKQAEEQLRKILELNPNAAGIHFTLGEIYMRMEDRPKAIRSYEEGLKIQPNAFLAANNLAYLYAQEKTRLSEALKLAEKANKAAKEKHPGILDTVGFVHLQREDYDNALKCLTNANKIIKEQIARNPKLQLKPNPTILYHLAVAYEKKGMRKEAQDVVEQALQIGSEMKEHGREFKEQKDAEQLLDGLKNS
jgi:tetratricopeptide (TPR) repeat protein